MGAFEPPPLGEARAPAKTRVLGAKVLLGFALVVGLVGINGGARVYAHQSAERLCAAAPPVGARFDLEHSITEALRERATIVLWTRDETRLGEIRTLVARLPERDQAQIRVIRWRGGDTLEAMWQPLFLARSTCTIEHSGGMVVDKRVDSMD